VTPVVFLGPTLSRDEAKSLFPDALFRPPATQSDIITAVENDRATAIGLIDGCSCTTSRSGMARSAMR